MVSCLRIHFTARPLFLAKPLSFTVNLRMADCLQLQPSARCPLAARHECHRRFAFKPALEPRQLARLALAAATATRTNSSTASIASLQTPSLRRGHVVCAAAATSAAAAAPTQQVDNVPRGETAGANLILENATVQAGHRDLLEVSDHQLGILCSVNCPTSVHSCDVKPNKSCRTPLQHSVICMLCSTMPSCRAVFPLSSHPLAIHHPRPASRLPPPTSSQITTASIQPQSSQAASSRTLNRRTILASRLQHAQLSGMQDVSWRLMPGQRVGLVGANGCGKSTLLRCLSGQRKIDNGRLVVGKSVEMGYLEQTAVSGSGRTVWEEARSRMTELIEAEAAIDAASQAASTGLPTLRQYCSAVFASSTRCQV